MFGNYSLSKSSIFPKCSKVLENALFWKAVKLNFLVSYFQKAIIQWWIEIETWNQSHMKNTKFSEYQRSLSISYATFELLKFESRTDVIVKISRFLRHRRPGINEWVFGSIDTVFWFSSIETKFKIGGEKKKKDTKQSNDPLWWLLKNPFTSKTRYED